MFTIAQAKAHIKDNKKVYLVGAGCLVVGLVAGSRNDTVVDSVKQINILSPGSKVVVTTLERRSCMEPIPIRCLETGEVFGSLRRAGEVLDIPRALISAQLDGKFEKANGMTFEKLAE